MSMASQVIREWMGIQQFPPATQTKLLELLGKLKQEGGVGKSSTVNSIIGEKAVTVSTFQSEGPRPVMVSRSRAGFTLNIVDTPGLIEGGYVNYHAIQLIKRVDNLDKQITRAITDNFGEQIWKRALIVLTHAQLSLPDRLDYEVFCSKRSEALLKFVSPSTWTKKKDIQGSFVPVVLVENSGRCAKNENDEKVLPNGTAWIPNLVKTITEVVLNGSKALVVDKKLVEGPNPNEKGKILIPVIFAFQYFFIIKPLIRAIKSDAAKEAKPVWARASRKL
ncbi:translocase of chloroplast 34 [Citrus sinensis]|uniref:Translocase of chloroplast 34 n=1 Tax=Citrus sinensis TaxID=2711 RepID=A0ACB8JYE5_CITSI|nr:translocase of chloroplast 34 [Citrus sinensis]